MLSGDKEMESTKKIIEEVKVLGHELADKVQELIHEGNVRRIIIKDEKGNTFVEIPVRWRRWVR